MRKGQKKLSGFRSRLSQYLVSLGYECFRRDKMKVGDRWFCNGRNPEVDVDFLIRDLMHINKGEAFFYGEGLTSDIASLPLHSKPDEYNPQPMGKTTAEFCRYLKSGMEFQYPNPYREFNDKGEIDWVQSFMKLIDFQNVGLNSFRAVERWQGRVDADFLWDYVVCVNSLPLVAIVIEPDETDTACCQHAYEAMRRELDGDYVLRTYLQFCIISNGTTTLVGSPVDSLENFKPWPSLMGEEPPVGFSVPAETAMVALLRPDRLLDVLQYNIHVAYRENDSFVHYFGDYHQYFSLLKLQDAVKAHYMKSDKPFIGYVDLLESESGLSGYWGDQAETCAMLACVRVAMGLMYAGVSDRDLRGYSCGLDDEILDELRQAEESLFLVFGPMLSVADHHRLTAEFPDASIIQFRQLPGDGEDGIGECIYKATYPIR